MGQRAITTALESWRDTEELEGNLGERAWDSTGDGSSYGMKSWLERLLELWRENSMVNGWNTSETIRRVKVSRLSSEPGCNMMTVAPAKIVPTIKSPMGKKKVRIVVCGNVHIKDVGNCAELEGSHQVEAPMRSRSWR